MLNWFLFSFNSIAPILILVFMGYFLKQKGILTPEFLSVGNRFCFHYCISTMLFKTVYDLDGLRSVSWKMCIFIVLSLGLLTLCGLAASAVCTDVRERRGVIAQTWMRSNNAIIGFPLAESIGGAEALAALAPLQIPSIAMYNSVSVICLTIFSRNADRKISWKRIGISILKNPLIRASLPSGPGVYPEGAGRNAGIHHRGRLPCPLHRRVLYLTDRDAPLTDHSGRKI